MLPGRRYVYIYHVCVLHIKPFFLPVDTQHSQCPCRFFNPREIQVREGRCPLQSLLRFGLRVGSRLTSLPPPFPSLSLSLSLSCLVGTKYSKRGAGASAAVVLRPLPQVGERCQVVEGLRCLRGRCRRREHPALRRVSG